MADSVVFGRTRSRTFAARASALKETVARYPATSAIEFAETSVVLKEPPREPVVVAVRGRFWAHAASP